MNATTVDFIVNAPPAALLPVKLTLLLASAWALHFALLRANPRWRVLLWRGVAAALVALPLLAALSPAWRVGLPVRPEPQIETPLTLAVPPLLPPPVIQPRLEMLPEVELPPAPPPASPARWDLRLAALWLAGALLLLLRFAYSQHAMRRLTRRAAPAPEAVQRIFSRLAAQTGLARVRLAVSDQVRSPLLHGLRRPVVLLPERMTRPEYAPDLPAIFAHELSHAAARDLAWLGLVRLVQFILWPHPLVWSMHAACAAATERACDAAAAAVLDDREVYSRSLARVALALAGRPVGQAALAMAIPDIRRRLLALKNAPSLTPPRRGMVRLAALAGLIGLAALGSMQPVKAEIPAEKIIEIPLTHVKAAEVVNAVNQILKPNIPKASDDEIRVEVAPDKNALRVIAQNAQLAQNASEYIIALDKPDEDAPLLKTRITLKTDGKVPLDEFMKKLTAAASAAFKRELDYKVNFGARAEVSCDVKNKPLQDVFDTVLVPLGLKGDVYRAKTIMIWPKDIHRRAFNVTDAELGEVRHQLATGELARKIWGPAGPPNPECRIYIDEKMKTLVVEGKDVHFERAKEVLGTLQPENPVNNIAPDQAAPEGTHLHSNIDMDYSPAWLDQPAITYNTSRPMLLPDFMDALAKRAPEKFNFTVSQDCNRMKVTGNFKNRSLREILDATLNVKGLVWQATRGPISDLTFIVINQKITTAPASLNDVQLRGVERMMASGELAKAVWGAAKPPSPEYQLTLDKGRKTLTIRGEVQHGFRVQAVLRQLGDPAAANMILRSYSINKRDVTTILARFQAAFKPGREARGIRSFIAPGILDVLDTPENIKKVEAILQTEKLLNSPVSVSTEARAPLDQFMKILSSSTPIEMEYSITEGAKAMISGNFQNKPLREVLDTILLPIGLSWFINDKNVIVIDQKLLTKTFTLSPLQMSKIKTLLVSREIQKSIWGQAEPPAQGCALILDERQSMLVATGSKLHIQRIESFMPSLGEAEAQEMIVRIYKINEKDRPRIQSLINPIITANPGAPFDRERKLFLDKDDLIIRDTPENIKKIEELLLEKKLIPDGWVKLDTASFSLVPRDTKTVTDQARAFGSRVVEAVKVFLYSQDGEAKAKAEGCTLAYDPKTLRLTITDTPTNLARVGQYIESLPELGVKTRQEVVFLKYAVSEDLARTINKRVIPESETRQESFNLEPGQERKVAGMTLTLASIEPADMAHLKDERAVLRLTRDDKSTNLALPRGERRLAQNCQLTAEEIKTGSSGPSSVRVRIKYPRNPSAFNSDALILDGISVSPFGERNALILRYTDPEAFKLVMDLIAQRDRPNPLAKNQNTATSNTQKTYVRTYTINAQDGPRIKSLINSVLTANSAKPLNLERRVTIDKDDLIVRDTPENIMRVEALLIDKKFIRSEPATTTSTQAINTPDAAPKLDIENFSLMPVGEKTATAQTRAIAGRVVEEIKKYLYGEESEEAANRQGRRLWYDTATLQLTIADTQERLKRVRDYLTSLPELKSMGAKPATVAMFPQAYPILPTQVTRLRALSDSGELQKSLWGQATPPDPGCSVTLDERRYCLVVIGPGQHQERAKAFLEKMKDPGAQDFITRFYRIKAQDGPRIQAIVDSTIALDQDAKHRLYRKNSIGKTDLYLSDNSDMTDLFLCDTPENIYKIENQLGGERLISDDHLDPLVTATFSLKPMNSRESSNQMQTFASRVAEAVKVFLYSREGEKKAATEGRHLSYDPGKLQLTIIDTPPNLHRVSQYIQSLPDMTQKALNNNNDKKLETQHFSLVPPNGKPVSEPWRDYARQRVDAVKVFLYAQTGEAKARESGRELRFDPTMLKLTITDTPENLARVQTYLTTDLAWYSKPSQEVIFLNYAVAGITAPALTKQIALSEKKMPGVTIEPFRDLNALIVRYDKQDDLKTVQEMVKELDVPLKQVTVETMLIQPRAINTPETIKPFDPFTDLGATLREFKSGEVAHSRDKNAKPVLRPVKLPVIVGMNQALRDRLKPYAIIGPRVTAIVNQEAIFRIEASTRTGLSSFNNPDEVPSKAPVVRYSPGLGKDGKTIQFNDLRVDLTDLAQANQNEKSEARLTRLFDVELRNGESVLLTGPEFKGQYVLLTPYIVE